MFIEEVLSQKFGLNVSIFISKKKRHVHFAFEFFFFYQLKIIQMFWNLFIISGQNTKNIFQTIKRTIRELYL